MDGLKARLSFDAVAYDYDDEYLTIDTDTHTININNVSRLFGVQYDGNSKLIKFKIRNKLSDIQKMQDSIVYINWIDSKGVKGQSIAVNKTINNDTCEFAWKVPFDALKNSGVLHFAMSAVVTKNSSSVIDQRWSTQIASVITPDGIYIKSYTPSSEEEDRIAQIYNELSNMINKQNENLQSQVNSLKEDLDKFNPLLSYVNVGGKVLSGVKNKIDTENIASTGFHIVTNVKPGEKYLINGSGFNENYPLYVICSDNAIVGYSDDTTYSYKSNIEIKIPYGATKLYVNAKFEYQPHVKKLVYDNHEELNEEKSYDIPLNVEHFIYHNEIENLTNDTGYSALIPVAEGDNYLLTGSGTGQYSSYILYDKNMSIVSFGESLAIEDKLVIIPKNVAYLRVQNNLRPVLKAIKYVEKNIIFIGDSYVQGNSLGNDKNKRFSTIISKMFRMKEINVGVGGCGYFKADNYPDYFYQQLINAIDSMSAKEWANTEYILVCGGRNDPNNYPNATQVEYDKAISDICDMSSKYFPYAKLVFVPFLFDSNYMPNNYYQYYLKLVNALKKNKCAVINYAYTWLTGKFADILADKVHPNVNGHDIIAHNLYNALNGGDNINSQSVRLMGVGEYTPEWTYIDCMLLGTDTLNIFGNFTISEDTPTHTIILEHTFEENDIYNAYTGRTSFSLLISNLSTGVSYSVYLKYENGKIRLYTNNEIPKGSYFMSYNVPFGRL